MEINRELVARLLNEKLKAENMTQRKAGELCYCGRTSIGRVAKAEANVNEVIVFAIIKGLNLPYDEELAKLKDAEEASKNADVQALKDEINKLETENHNNKAFMLRLASSIEAMANAIRKKAND